MKVENSIIFWWLFFEITKNYDYKYPIFNWWVKITPLVTKGIMLDHLSFFAKRVVRLNDHCRTAAKHLECLLYNKIIFWINLYLALHAVHLWVQKFAKKGRQKNRRHWTWKLMQRDIVEFMSEKSHKNPSVFNIRALRVLHTNIKRLL